MPPRRRSPPTASQVIKLSIDARLQAKLEALVEESVARLGPKLSAAIVVIDNMSGEVRARVGAADYVDASRGGAIDMSRAPRSPGSALKPFIYALAFEQGLAHPETVLFDRPVRYGAYAPENFDLGYQGTVTARKALQMSLNLPAIELLADVGPATFLARLHSAGAEIALPKDTPVGLAIGLGGLGISLTDLARLYAGLRAAARRRRCSSGSTAAPSSGRDASPIRSPPIMSRIFCAARRRQPTRSVAGSPSRPARPTASATRWRSASTRDDDRGLGRAARQWADARPHRPPGRGADPVRRVRAARPRHRADPPAKGRAAVAASADLPPPLRHLRKDAPKTIAATATAALKIAFPPDGARIDLGLREGARDDRLALKALGGAPPLTWFVNGAPIGEADLRRQSAWRPDGAGFSRVSVMDAKGESDAVMVRLE